VRTDRVNDVDVVWTQGKNHLIAAHLVHCGGKPRCEGVRYVAVMPQSASTGFVNRFNRDRTYSKIILSDEGKVVISVELFTIGGVTGQNLAHNALGLMYRMTQFNEAIAQASLKVPLPEVTLAESVASRAEEGWLDLPPNLPTLRVDPAVAKGFVEQIKAGD
jgi:hypothetical protein